MYIVPKTVSAGLLLSGAATSAQARMPEAPQKPNIVYIIADQLRWDALGYTGNAKAVTPNIDRFAAQALDFTEAVSSTPVSAAHRACLITGKYQSSTGMVINEINLNPNHRTWAHVLGDAGYKLGYVGKHHGPICTAATASRGPNAWDSTTTGRPIRSIIRVTMPFTIPRTTTAAIGSSS